MVLKMDFRGHFQDLFWRARLFEELVVNSVKKVGLGAGGLAPQCEVSNPTSSSFLLQLIFKHWSKVPVPIGLEAVG